MTAQAQADEEELAMTALARGDRGDKNAARSSRSNVFRQMRAQQGSGAGMDMPTLQRFNAAFGQSFDHVRIHTGGPADAINRDMKARAVTTGSDIFFRAGAYTPGTPEGDHLLAHELTHVVQQGQGVVPAGHQSSGGAAGRTPADPFERQAEATADAMTGNRPGGNGALPAVQRLAQP
jgi:hypothetical protein